MTLADTVGFLADMGVSIASLIFGAIGALLGIAYTPPMTRGQMLAALGSGIVCALLGPEIVVLWWKLPGVMKNGLAFCLGIGGMFIVPGIIKLWTKFRDDPFWVIDWVRGIRTQEKGEQPKGEQP